MQKSKDIEDLKFEGDLKNTLQCLWKMRHGEQSLFMAYGKNWIEKVINDRVTLQTIERLKNSTSFKKEGVFREAYIAHKGNQKKVMAAMNISDRTYFRHKKTFIDDDTKKEVRKLKYTNGA